MVFASSFTNTTQANTMDTSGFGGGGFMQETSPMDSSQEKKKYTSRAQSVTPCTVAMAVGAEYDQIKDSYTFGDVPVHQVKLVAKIREVEESATNFVYTVSDSTGGGLVVRKWLDKDESDAEREKRLKCREDTYVRITGSLKAFQDSKNSIIGFKIVPVTDFNEIAYHMLEVVYSHLTVTKRPEIFGEGNTKLSADGGMQIQGENEGSAASNTTGMTKAQQDVMNCISDCMAEQGISIDEIRQKVRLSEKQLRDAVDFLSNEGHVYSTIDDDHFRSTSS